MLYIILILDFLLVLMTLLYMKKNGLYIKNLKYIFVELKRFVSEIYPQMFQEKKRGREEKKDKANVNC